MIATHLLRHVLVAATVGWMGVAASQPLERPLDAERRAEIVQMVRQDCGSCHGLTLKGGLGPSLLPEALADKDPEVLAYVIRNGRRGTPMPPWREHLTGIEARWVVEQLKKGFPE
ncbi:MAG TPA: cytochrome c [Burkholderiales bacterium]|nr:cytochrome c [Burkholderiales bacterium]